MVICAIEATKLDASRSRASPGWASGAPVTVFWVARMPERGCVSWPVLVEVRERGAGGNRNGREPGKRIRRRRRRKKTGIRMFKDQAKK